MNTDRLRLDIDLFVTELLGSYEPRARHPKVLHDPIWGTHEFQPHEIALIDSPVIQRLRRIYQTGFSFLTYPSTTQTRFEHSIGAAIVGTRMMKAIAEKHSEQVTLHPIEGDLATIRTAALLHDCGHGFASHASEQLYRWHPDIEDARSVRDEFRDAKASELLSWYIITSQPFRKLLERINEQYGTLLEVDRIADLLLGIPYDQRTFLGEMINGPFDVDRVDYTVRDADYSGIKAGIDLERFFHDLDIALLRDGQPHLVLHSTHAIEQLLFTKVHLFVRLYRHQKVLASDALVQSLVAAVKSDGTNFCGVTFDKVSDYLRVNDFQILAQQGRFSVAVSDVLRRLRFRDLPERCLVITNRKLKASGVPEARIHSLTRLSESAAGLQTYRRRIWEKIPEGHRSAEHLIFPVFPEPTPLREATQVYIALREELEAVTLNQVFSIDEWLTTFTESHWAGFVFSPAEDRQHVTRAALAVLAEDGIPMDEASAVAIQRPAALTVAPRQIRSPDGGDDELFQTAIRLPVLEAYTQSVSGRPFEGLWSVLLLHFLTDLPPFLARFEQLGLDPRRTSLVRKPYQYRRVEEVTTELAGRGYRVQRCTAAESTSEPATRALRELARELPSDGRVLVVEDGGFITPLLHQDEFASLRSRCLGAVEQTTKGLRNIERIQPLLLPVVSVAGSVLKLRLEAADVGDALGFTIESYVRTKLGQTLGQVPTLVVGFGAVGRSLAAALAQRQCEVTIFDKELEARIEASVYKAHRLGVLETLDDLSRFRLVIGTTGSTSINRQSLLTLPDGAVLASGSSDRLEIDLAALIEEVRLPSDENVKVDGLITYYTLRNNRTIGVLCDGYPINFILGDGIAKTVIDPILAELLAGAVALANRMFPAAGIHKLSREVEQELWRYYATFTGRHV
jgi:uncharacterized protein